VKELIHGRDSCKGRGLPITHHVFPSTHHLHFSTPSSFTVLFVVVYLHIFVPDSSFFLPRASIVRTKWNYLFVAAYLIVDTTDFCYHSIWFVKLHRWSRPECIRDKEKCFERRRDNIKRIKLWKRRLNKRKITN
jgi:hypothetical protein